MATLTLDTASLQALRDLTSAVRTSAASQRQSTSQTPGGGWADALGSRLPTAAMPMPSAMPPAMPHMGTGMPMGMGLQRWQHPVNGQVGWMPGGGGPGGYGAAAAAGGRGMAGTMMGGLSRFAAPAAIASFGASALTSAAGSYHDKYMGGAAAERKFFRDVVPFGASIQSGIDDISGRTAQMVDNKVQADIMGRRGALETERLGLMSTMRPQIAGQTAYAQAFKSQTAAVPPVMDRSTAGGEQAYRDAMKVLPLRQESLKTEREMKRAVAERAAAEHHANTVLNKRKEVETQIAEARENAEKHKGRRSDLEDKYRRQVDTLQSQHDDLRPAAIQAQQTVAEKRTQEGIAVAEHAKAKSREEKLGAAEIAQGQADRAKGTAMTLGAMDPLQRAQATQAVLLGKQHGVDALPPEMKAMFAQLAPQEFEAAAVKAGSASDEFGQLQSAGVVDAPGKKGESPAKLQEKADTLRSEAGKADHDIDAKAAEIGAQAGDKMASAIAAAIDAAVDQVEKKVADRMRMGRN